MKMTSFRFFRINFIIFFVGALVKKSALIQLEKPSYYTAGVVEFRPNVFGMTAVDMLADHLRDYEKIIRSNEANLTDIIVFPEGTLNNNYELTYVPAQVDNVNPCLEHVDPNNGNEFADFLIKISCIARDVRKYVVINVVEKEKCSTVVGDPRPCASNGLNIYNTNAVFDREGYVISRYRKVHLYVEAKNTTYSPEVGIFVTDFGVRFGHFICFDILFYKPAQELVSEFRINNLIFTSMFYSELPFLTAAQLQQSWAWGNNVNLLAAGASYPEAGITGTGIYAGNTGNLISKMVGSTGIRKLFVAQVPIRNFNSIPLTNAASNNSIENPSNRQTPQTFVKLLKDPQIEKYNSELLNFSHNSHVSRVLCYGNFCCHFHIEISLNESVKNSQHYKYRIGIFDGRRSYEKKEWSDIKVCALYACTNDEAHSCGEIFNPNIKVEPYVLFQSIEINGEFNKVQKMLIMPNSLNDELYSLNSDAVFWNKTNKESYIDVSYKLMVPQENLLTFGIYAQYYEKSFGKKNFEFSLLVLLMSFAAFFFA